MVVELRRFAQVAVVALILVLASAIVPGVHAADAAGATDVFAGDVPTRVWIDLGWSNNDISTSASFTGPNGLGATIDFEDVFDMPVSRSTARGFGTVRISKERRYIDFGYVDINRSGSKVIDQDIDWGGATIGTNSSVTANFNTGFIYCAYRYDFLHLEPVHISGSAGLTWLNISTSLDASGTITPPDGGPQVSSYYKKGSVGAPVPMLGLNLDWAIHRRLVVRSYTRFFRINTSEFSGALNESGIRLNWYFVKNFGLGIGYDRTDLNLKELKVNENTLKANYYFSGASLFITLAF